MPKWESGPDMQEPILEPAEEEDEIVGEPYDPDYAALVAEMEKYPDWPIGDVFECYLCTLKAGGDPFAKDGHPERKCVKTSTCNPADPTAVYVLECGHGII